MEIVKYLISVANFCSCLVSAQTLLDACPHYQQTETKRHLVDLFRMVKEQTDQIEGYNKQLTAIQRQSSAIEKVLEGHETAISTLARKMADVLNVSSNRTEEFIASNWSQDSSIMNTDTECRADIIFMIDSSSSSCEGKAFNKQLEFCKTVLKEAYIDAGYIRVGLLTYNDRSKIEFHLNKHSTKSDLFAAMDQLNCTSGLTNMADALSAVRTAMFIPENGDRPDASNIAVLITDGLSNVKDGRTILEADLTRKGNIQIYTKGIGVPFLKEMRNIASKPLWRFLYDVSNVEELIQLGPHIYETICKR